WKMPLFITFSLFRRWDKAVKTKQLGGYDQPCPDGRIRNLSTISSCLDVIADGLNAIAVAR
ncbi:MAG: hypothetical protein ACPGVO_14935, partial [Spirulinaceae cyanobacterium]